MALINKLKNIINKIKPHPLLLYSSDIDYTDLISSEEINNMINNMPQDLSKLEKAYYIYIELGKLVKQDPKYVFSDPKNMKLHYKDAITKDFYGTCKSISELYVSILKDERIGISADLVKRYPLNRYSHIDVILKIDGKNYIANLISDLSRIKTSRKVNSFCFDLDRIVENIDVELDNERYLKILQHHYGKIDFLSRKEIDLLNKKLGYSFFIPQFSDENDRGIYTDDTIDLLAKEMNNPEYFKKYVLHDKEAPKEEHLKYKLEYIFENINKITDFNSDMDYLENIRYLIKISSKIFDESESRRIVPYAAVAQNDFSDIISIIKLKPSNKSKFPYNRNIYYLYSPEEKQYVKKSSEELQTFIKQFEENSLQIVGELDHFSPREIEELEIK